MVVLEMFRYDTIFYNIQEFETAKPGITKVDTEGFCDTCKMKTRFWELNIKVYICCDNCRNILYKRLEEASMKGETVKETKTVYQPVLMQEFCERCDNG
jgi:hypothetical protein